jgi:hypothetical protein
MNAMTHIEQRRLSRADWQIVEMARSDGPRSLNPDSFFARLTDNLFALPCPQRLASDELEALRRFSVRAWYWDTVRASDVDAVLDAGFTNANAQRILAYIAHHRGFAPPFHEASA